MRKQLAITVAVSLMVTACSQPANNARYYQYGGILSAGSSLGLHTMRKNETLFAVAKAYDVDLRDMLDLNRLSAPYRVRVGERIKIPAPANYKVRTGDTLYKVSRMFDTTTTELARLNELKAPYKLSVGNTLRLPPRYPKPTAVTQQSSAQIYSNAQSAKSKNSGRIEREVLSPAVTPQMRDESLVSSPQPSVAPKNPEAPPAILQTPVLTGSVNFIKPVAGKIISGYGPKEDGLHNDGINIKAAAGDAVRASEQGIVVYQGNQIEGYGNMVLIRHANGYLTAYAHMQKTLVKKGDRVKRGQTIGTVGSSGNVKTPQLHFEIRKGRDALDPQKLIRT